MARLSSLPFGSTHPWFALVLGTVLLASCASTPDFSALEDDELYLRRGEEFVTDAAYLAFAYENNATEAAGDDYYDPARGTDFGPGYMNSYGMPGYQPSYYNRHRPFGGGFGSGFGTQWGLSSYMNPYAAGGLGMGYGMGMGGYDPFYNGWGNPYSMGYGSGFGYGNPYAWNNGWGSSWNNPYGYNNWNNGWNTNYGGWTGTGTNDSFTSLTGRTRTPIMSYTSSGSNYDQEGVLVRPKVEVQRPDEVPAAAPARTEEASPTYVSPRESRRARGWMQPDNSTRQSSPTRSWSSPSPSNNSNNSNDSFNNSSRSRSNSFSAPSNSSGGSRSNGSSGSSSGNSRSSSSSRSSRGGGR